MGKQGLVPWNGKAFRIVVRSSAVGTVPAMLYEEVSQCPLVRPAEEKPVLAGGAAQRASELIEHLAVFRKQRPRRVDIRLKRVSGIEDMRAIVLKHASAQFVRACLLMRLTGPLTTPPFPAFMPPRIT